MTDDQSKSGNTLERFFRERRLLLGVSIVLLLHQLLNITIDPAAETLGLHFEINHPERLFLVVWLVWLWTIASYLQQFTTLKLWKMYPIDRQLETRDRICRRIVLRRARNRLCHAP